MDSAMRDLDLIQERRGGEESPGRKAAMLGMAGLSTVALVFAMGVILGGGGDEGDAPTREDPLAALAPAMSEDAPAEDPEAAEAPDAIAPGEVQFHDRLTDPRPEVEAALAAAAAEERVLANQAPLGAGETIVPQANAQAPIAVAPSAAPAGDIARLPTEGAIPEDTRPAVAGREGAFTLQVVSYRTRAEADLFSDALRGRGHSSYVTRTELPDRGTYFRVRIGPFENRVAAERYRATFEREENMNTYVVDELRAAANELAARGPRPMAD